MSALESVENPLFDEQHQQQTQIAASIDVAVDESILLGAAIDDVKHDEEVTCPDHDTQQEQSCKKCGIELGPQKPPGHSLCDLHYQGGTFSTYLLESEHRKTLFGVRHRVYPITCRWEKRGQKAKQWTMCYSFTEYRSLRRYIKSRSMTFGDDADNEIDFPKLPKRRRAFVLTESATVVLPPRDRIRYLQYFLHYIFQGSNVRTPDGDVGFLTIDSVDNFFKIRENVFDNFVPIDEGGSRYSAKLDKSEIELLRVLLLCVKRRCTPNDAARMADVLRDVCSEWMPRHLPYHTWLPRS
jgi:hypothetical protein